MFQVPSSAAARRRANGFCANGVGAGVTGSPHCERLLLFFVGIWDIRCMPDNLTVAQVRPPSSCWLDEAESRIPGWLLTTPLPALDGLVGQAPAGILQQ